MQTTLLVEPGQSFILAGLYNQTDTDSMSRFPGLGSVPILGSFFRNSWNTRAKSEMVVVIRPEVIYSNTGASGPQTTALPTPTSTAELSKK
jgi:type II secretory pathway component GspD/PulD (secretin)